MSSQGFFWDPAPGFGGWLRQLRAEAGLSLRAAAKETGLSFNRLQQMEIEGSYRPPAPALLRRLALLYGVPPEALLERAGFREVTPQGLIDETDPTEAFRRLVLDPRLSPPGFDAAWVEAFSTLQRAQWVDFARRLEAWVLEGGEPLEALLAEGASSEILEELSEASPRRRGRRDREGGRPRLVAGRMYYWSYHKGFGGWLRSARREAGMTLKEAAEAFEVSYTLLQAVEMGKAKRPSLYFVDDVAEAFNIHVDEVLEAAGYDVRDFKRPDKAGPLDQELAAIVLHPALRPIRMGARWLQSYSELQKSQWIAFAERIEAFVEGGGRLEDVA